MLKSYVTIAIRHLTRQKGYTTINVAGLAVGMVCALLITLITIGYHVVRTARTNPADVLRNE